jgi:hypothetical protein
VDEEDAAQQGGEGEDNGETVEDGEEDEGEDDDLDAVDVGPRVEDVEFLDALFEFIRELRADAGDFEQPEWAASVTFSRLREQSTVVRDAEASANEALAVLDQARSTAAELDRRKILITGTGRALEIVVEEAFEALGFTVEAGEAGRTDRIMRIGGRPPVVLEVKGRAKGAQEADSAQLEKWVSEYLLAEGEQPKAFLVVNAWRDLLISERADAAFPDQMVRYATAREHCLITGYQLLCAWLDVEEHPEKQEAIVEALYSTSGRFPLYGNWSALLDAGQGPTTAADEVEELKG